MQDRDRRHMAHALTLARRGLGRCWPNPAVGCVIVHENRILGRGWTQPGGRPHAETEALRQAGPAAFGATAYVTLEPCAHHGQTPPCADALIAAGISRVVAAVQDADPRVSGRGFERLRAAGVEVTCGVLADLAARDHAGFFLRQGEGRPFLTLKLASSLDGRIATAGGESQWITGSLARRSVHILRANHDAVMVGAGTARADDPSLTIRDLGVGHQPVRVVVSRGLDLPLNGRLALTIDRAPVWICHGPDADPKRRLAWQERGARLVPCMFSGGGVDIMSALTGLAQAGLTRVLCEGGGQLAGSLLAAGVVDELICFGAGIALGADGLPSIGPLGLETLALAERFELAQLRPVGEDVMQVWQRRR